MPTTPRPGPSASTGPCVASQLPREVGSAVLGGVTGVLCGITMLLVGVRTDIVGVVFHRPEDYPYGGAWCVLSLLVGVVAGSTSWWVLRRRR